VGAAAAGFALDQTRAAAGGLRILDLVGRVAAAAAGLGLPVVFLKFAALELGGRLAPGSRSASDLDVLVPAAGAAALQRALAATGFQAGGPAQPHHLATLAGRDGAIEVHRRLLGVRIGARRSAGVEELDRAGLLMPLPELPGCAAIPAPPAAAAHALVHGLAQHGWSPHAYSLLKMIADLIDLGFAEPAGEVPAARAAAWVERDVAAGEVAAVRDLAVALAAGVDLSGWGGSTAGAALLLRHALAGRLDAAYERSLRLSVLRRQPSDDPEPLRLARLLAGTVWLSRAQVDALYGPPRGRLGYLTRRLARPFDLLRRLGIYGVNAWRLRRHGPV